MARYKVSFFVTGANIKGVQKKVAEVFGPEIGEQITAAVKKIEPSHSRADRLGDIESTVQECASDAGELRDELQEWFDNLPENFQNGDKGSELTDAISELETLIESLESVDFSSISFPQMF